MSTEESLIDQRYADTQAERYGQTLASITARLRDLADRIEREGEARVGSVNADGKVDYLHAAERAVHELHWGIANLHVGNLLSAAADAHSAVRGRIK